LPIGAAAGERCAPRVAFATLIGQMEAEHTQRADQSSAWPRVAAIAGVGLMGAGFAQLFALAGIETVVADASAEQASAGRERAIELASAFEASGLMAPGSAERIAERVQAAPSLEAAAERCELLLEAVTESPAVKHGVYRRAEAVMGDEGVIATNTSAIPIRELSPALRIPERFIGTHWFNPPQWIPCVEVIAGPSTSPEVIAKTESLLARLGKKPVVVGDAGGFVANRLQFAMYKEAVSIVADGVATPEQVDEVVRNSFGFRLPIFGPFMIADMAGLDVYAGAYAAVEADLGARFAAPAELSERVARGAFGAKTGGGFTSLGPADLDRVAQQRDRAYVALSRMLAQLDAVGDAPPQSA
jgi:3-hydroxybutyryl-CoA dehydrogenase